MGQRILKNKVIFEEDMKNDLLEAPQGKSLWQDAMSRLFKDKSVVISFLIVVIYSLVALLSAFGVIAADWDVEVGGAYMAPSLEFFAGTDFLGRSVMTKIIHGTQVAMSVGLFTVLIAVPIGIILGAVSGYFGGMIDEMIVWLYTTVSSIPSIMLIISISLIMGKGLLAVYVALGTTSWVTLCRLIRGEVMKHKNREYVQAASAIGGSHFRKLFIHILPNIFHIVIINASLQFQTAIKSEVILSFLGIGVQNQPSWGTMINDAKLELVGRGAWWQLAGATIAMFCIVLAFNVIGDALRDALDPKLKGK
jgi:ABC-type dipeptide/oligopeptide/nickel transport system permease subunit